jgi:hypothetical protein
MHKVVRNRKKGMLWTYKDCFVGRQALEWIRHHARVEGRPDNVEAATTLATLLMQTGVIVRVDHKPAPFDPTQLYRLRRGGTECAFNSVDACGGASGGDGEGADGGAARPMDFSDHCGDVGDDDADNALMQYTSAMNVLASAMQTGVQPTGCCRERIAQSVPALLARAARMHARMRQQERSVAHAVEDLRSSPLPPLSATVFDEVKCTAGSEAEPLDAALRERARALREALRAGRDSGCTGHQTHTATHTLYTQADRLRSAYLSLCRDAADTTRRYNLTHCPLLMLLCIDGVRPCVLQHLRFTELCQLRLLCKPAVEFVGDMLAEMPMPWIIGGNRHGRALSSAKQLRMGSMTWESLPPLLEPRADPATCRLAPGGQILVAGGQGNHMDELPTAEVYQPLTGRWEATPAPMARARTGCRACSIGEHGVVVMGGFDGRGAVADAEVYCPVTGRWRRAQPMHTARTKFVACTLLDGRVIVAGGFNERGALSEAEIWDPGTDAWTELPAMQQARCAAAGALLPSGLFAIVGGRWAISDARMRRDGEVFDITARMWHSLPDMRVPRSGQAAMAISGGLIVLGGAAADSPSSAGSQGQGQAAAPSAPYEFFDENSWRWLTLPHQLYSC